jgi:hypothetical protein
VATFTGSNTAEVVDICLLFVLSGLLCVALVASPEDSYRVCRPTLTPSVIAKSNYFITVSDWNCLKHFCMFFRTVIIRCTETFWSPCIIPPSTTRSSTWPRLRFPHQPLYAPLLHTRYIPHQFHYSPYCYLKNTGWRLQIIKLLIMHLSPFPWYLHSP